MLKRAEHDLLLSKTSRTAQFPINELRPRFRRRSRGGCVGVVIKRLSFFLPQKYPDTTGPIPVTESQSIHDITGLEDVLVLETMPQIRYPLTPAVSGALRPQSEHIRHRS